MVRHSDLTRPELREKLKSGEIKLGGNIRLRIYGTLACQSGKKVAVAKALQKITSLRGRLPEWTRV